MAATTAAAQVLVVEDERDIAALVAYHLTREGYRVRTVGTGDDAVDEWDLSVPYDVSTGTYVDTLDVSAEESVPYDIAFNADGSKLYVVGSDDDAVDEWDLSTPYDVSTGSYVDSLDVSTRVSESQGVAFNNDGTELYVLGVLSDDIGKWVLSTPYDVSTGSFVDTLDVSAQDSNPQGLTFNNDGTKLFVVGLGDQAVDEYHLDTPQTLAGNLTATNALHTLTASNTLPLTIASTASTTNFTVHDGAEVDLPSAFTVDGSYTNNGSLTSFLDEVTLTGGAATTTYGGSAPTLGSLTQSHSVVLAFLLHVLCATK